MIPTRRTRQKSRRHPLRGKDECRKHFEGEEGPSRGNPQRGEQQMLSIGRTLMGKPKLILMDEPSLGLAPLLAGEIFRVTQQLNEEGTTVLLVEQNAKALLKISHRAYVMKTGQVVLEGPSRELSENEEVKRAYLGKGSSE